MSIRHLIGLVFAFALCTSALAGERAATTLPADASNKRVALVIGNGAYQFTTPLNNPANDARDISALLRKLDFQVIEGIDLDRRGMVRHIQQFSDAAQGAGVSLFYYAGHGIQDDGQNYLLPIDARIEDQVSLRVETIDVDEVYRVMVGQSRVAIALLDACRDSPLLRQFAGTRSVSRGLAPPGLLGGGLLIGYATAPGQTAEDGDGKNSPFAAALLAHLGEPGLEIEQALKRVKAAVIAATENRQRPWLSSDLATDFYMVPSVKRKGQVIDFLPYDVDTGAEFFTGEGGGETSIAKSAVQGDDSLSLSVTARASDLALELQQLGVAKAVADTAMKAASRYVGSRTTPIKFGITLKSEVDFYGRWVASLDSVTFDTEDGAWLSLTWRGGEDFLVRKSYRSAPAE